MMVLLLKYRKVDIEHAHTIHCLGYTTYLRLVARTRLLMVASMYVWYIVRNKDFTRSTLYALVFPYAFLNLENYCKA